MNKIIAIVSTLFIYMQSFVALLISIFIWPLAVYGFFSGVDMVGNFIISFFILLGFYTFLLLITDRYSSSKVIVLFILYSMSINILFYTINIGKNIILLESQSRYLFEIADGDLYRPSIDQFAYQIHNDFINGFRSVRNTLPLKLWLLFSFAGMFSIIIKYLYSKKQRT